MSTPYGYDLFDFGHFGMLWELDDDKMSGPYTNRMAKKLCILCHLEEGSWIAKRMTQIKYT